MGLTYECLASIKAELSELLTSRPEIGNFTINSYSHFIGYFESVYTLLQLDELFAEIEAGSDSSAVELGNQAYSELVEFLADRWARIQNTSSCYTLNNELPANILCLKLAKLLATKEKSYWQLLVPTLTVTYYPITTTSLFDDDLYPGTFVLGKNLNHIIEVEYIVTCYAEDPNNALVYTHTETKQPLSEDDAKRLYNYRYVVPNYLRA